MRNIVPHVMPAAAVASALHMTRWSQASCTYYSICAHRFFLFAAAAAAAAVP